MSPNQSHASSSAPPTLSGDHSADADDMRSSTLAFILERTLLNDSDNACHPANYNSPSMRTPFPRRQSPDPDQPTWDGEQGEECILGYRPSGEPHIEVTFVGSTNPTEEMVDVYHEGDQNPTRSIAQTRPGGSLASASLAPKRRAPLQSRLSEQYIHSLAGLGQTYTPGQGASPTPTSNPDGRSERVRDRYNRARDVLYQPTPNGARLDVDVSRVTTPASTREGEEEARRERGTGGPARLTENGDYFSVRR
ncbi:hypothetical protein IAR50_000699 [Cryptococcus sp. DSM 104548]